MSGVDYELGQLTYHLEKAAKICVEINGIAPVFTNTAMVTAHLYPILLGWAAWAEKEKSETIHPDGPKPD